MAKSRRFHACKIPVKVAEVPVFKRKLSIQSTAIHPILEENYKKKLSEILVIFEHLIDSLLSQTMPDEAFNFQQTWFGLLLILPPYT